MQMHVNFLQWNLLKLAKNSGSQRQTKANTWIHFKRSTGFEMKILSSAFNFDVFPFRLKLFSYHYQKLYTQRQEIILHK